MFNSRMTDLSKETVCNNISKNTGFSRS